MDNNIILYFITVLSLIIVPGPDMLYVTSRALASGRTAGIQAAIGISLGYLVFTVFVAVGIETLFKTYPNLFLIIKIMGMCYLLYLAYQLFVADILNFSSIKKDAPELFDDIKHGFFTSVLNPKGLIFYFSLLPQFYTLNSMPFWLYALVFGSIASFLCFSIYSLVGIFASGKGSEILFSQKNGELISKLASMSVFVIAISLFISDM